MTLTEHSEDMTKQATKSENSKGPRSPMKIRATKFGSIKACAKFSAIKFCQGKSCRSIGKSKTTQIRKKQFKLSEEWQDEFL
ncbi:hypothetical protein NPIL_351501 [Nephila pilipes]|uniref:Uncharacterized protein n=1 Tax=Nephila pilipes TaxID=299642 RepID=A0A8X6PH89_NEPPI|nr:hypothetical protein NPIL_351501 [Nephila pilipes]